MSSLSDYLAARRQDKTDEDEKRALEDSSPEAVLEALRTNTGNTSDLLGSQAESSRTQNKAVVDSLELVVDAVEELKQDPQNIEVRKATEAEQSASKLTNTTLISINESLKALVETNQKVEKYLRPDLNPTDDTYQKEKLSDVEKEKKAAKEAAKNSNSNPLIAGLGSLLATGFDWIAEKVGKKLTPAEAAKEATKDLSKAGEAAKPTAGGVDAAKAGEAPKGRLGRFVDGTKRTLGSIGTKTAETVTRFSPKVQSFVNRAYAVTGNALTKTGEVVAETAQKYTPKVAETAARAKEAAKPMLSKAGSALSTAGEKTASFLSRAQAAVQPAITKADSFANRAIDSATKAGSKVISVGTDLVGKLKAAPAAAVEAVGDVGKAASGVADDAAKAAGGAAKTLSGASKGGLTGLIETAANSKVGKFLGKAAAPVAVGMSGYEAYQTEQDTTKTRDEKNVSHAGTAGGLAGGMAGASQGALAGAALGTVVPGVGNVVGGVVGGIAGGVGGYFAGKSVGSTVMGAAQSARDMLPDSVKNGIGASVALAISPFSKEARDALKNDFAPEMQKVSSSIDRTSKDLKESTEETRLSFTKLINDYTEKLTDTGRSIGNAAASAWQGAKSAAEATGGAAKEVAKGAVQGAKEGYEKNGVVGGLKGAATGSREAGQKVSGEWTKDMAVSKGIATGRFNTEEREALSTAKDAGEKFRGGKGLTQETKDMITKVATEKGIDPKHMIAMAQMESGGNPNAISSTGASGLFQMTGGTAKALGLKNRFDPEQNTRAAADLYLKNKASLEKSGEKTTLDNIYLAHQEGAAGAANILKASRGEGQLGSKIKENMSVNVGGNEGGATDAERAQKFIAKNQKVLASASDRAEKTTVANNTYVDTRAAKKTTGVLPIGKPVDDVAATLAAIKPGVAVTTKPVVETAVATEKKAAPNVNVAMGDLNALVESSPTSAGILTSDKPETKPTPKIRPVAVAPVVAASEPVALKPAAYGEAGRSTSKTQKYDVSTTAAEVSATAAAERLKQDPEISKMLASGDVEALSQHPAMQQFVNDPEVKTVVSNKALGVSASGSTEETSEDDEQFEAAVRRQNYGQKRLERQEQVRQEAAERGERISNCQINAKVRAMEAEDVRIAKEERAGQNSSTNAVQGSETPKFETSRLPMVSDDGVDAMYPTTPTGQITAQQPRVNARSASPSKVADNVPEEIQTVSVDNLAQTAKTNSEVVPNNASMAFDTAVPKLDSIPLQISDLGLILLNVGHL